MSLLRLSAKMKAAMGRLYKTNGQSDFVNMYTAIALQNRNLVSVSQLQYRTAAGQFPEYMTTLTQNGTKWCKRYFTTQLK